MAGRTIFQTPSFFHRLVGARGSAGTHDLGGWNPQETETRPVGIFLANRAPNMGQLFPNGAAAAEIAKHRVVFFGELHSRPPIVAFQRAVQDAMAKAGPPPPPVGTLHVVLEHFSFDMQGLLDAYLEGSLSFEQLLEKYHEIGTEGHDLEPYRPFLEDSKRLQAESLEGGGRTIRLHAGFLSRKYARLFMKEGEESCLRMAAPWLPPNPDLTGNDEHYNIFESLLTGRALVSEEPPGDGFRRIFRAQVLKDVAMAHKIHSVVRDSGDRDDKVLVLVGNGHVLGYRGVPERFLQENPHLAAETCVLVSNHETDLSLSGGDEQGLKEGILQRLNHAWGPCQLADYIYVYQEQEQERQVQEAVREETKAAYDKVGESAHLPGNAAKAKAIMEAMRYSEEQIAIAGEDIHNFQGVGNPHLRANIRPGETVLDVGSGLGIDSFIAGAAAAPTGFVLGIDLSNAQVKHAQSCVQRRQMDRIRFAAADMERIPLPDDSVDVVISNGAFCLAPDKQKAFREVFRVLKPGGRISICTTTTQDESTLAQRQPGVAWPVCMNMFVAKNKIRPICEAIGYVDVEVDESDSSMSMELPVEVLQENSNDSIPSQQQRSKVHVGSAEFRHLEDYDMDALCARVCVVARKPIDS